MSDMLKSFLRHPCEQSYSPRKGGFVMGKSVFVQSSLFRDLASQVLETKVSVTLNSVQARQVQSDYSLAVDSHMQRIREEQRRAHEEGRRVSLL